MKKLLKQQSKFVVAKIIPSEFHPSFLVSQFLKKSLREKRSWPLQFLTKTEKQAYLEDKSVNLPNALYNIRPTTQIYLRYRNLLTYKKICPITARARAVGGRFALARTAVRSHLKATVLTGYRKASW